MHCTHGLGTVVRRETRQVLGQKGPYYAVRIGAMTVWVPIDGLLSKRLRRPTGKLRFKRTIALLGSPGDLLPSDRRERRFMLGEYLKDGTAEGLVRIVRSLEAQRKLRALNDSDAAVMQRVETVLLGEWAHVLDITALEAASQFRELLRASTH